VSLEWGYVSFAEGLAVGRTYATLENRSAASSGKCRRQKVWAGPSVPRVHSARRGIYQSNERHIADGYPGRF